MNDNFNSEIPVIKNPNVDNNGLVNKEEIELNKLVEKKGRKFTIANIRKEMSSAEKEKSRSAVMSGICILGTIAAAYFHNQDVNQMVSSELNAVYSLDVIGKYVEDVGTLTTLLSASSLGFIAKYLVNSKKLKNAQDSLEKLMTYVGLELGGNENAKSR